ncbi:hypothetical protein [Luteimonas sp. SDU101]|uniref:hypothetical protein n=1 Tax=Luteimonas sp. SDU101 TaxID=3422593 RepID=UPI003EBB1F5B
MRVDQDNAWREAAGRPQVRVLLLAALCLVPLLALLVRLDGSRPGTAAAAVDAAPRLAAVAPAAPSAEVVAAPLPRATVAPRRTTALPTHVAARRREFDTSTDLFAFAQQLQPEARDGAAEAIWLLSRVIDECRQYAADPAAFARDSAVLSGLRLPASRAMQAARSRVDSRCRRFGPGDGLSQVRVGQLRVQSARAGGLVAEAELFARGEPLSAERGYGEDLLQRIGAAGDPQAFGALSSAGEVTGWLSMLDLDIAPQYAPLVWQIAACRMGVDCGPQSPVMTSYCVNGGICSRLPEQGFEEFVYDAAVPRQSADVVREAVSALVERFGGRP